MNYLDQQSETVAFLLPVVESSHHDWPILKHVALALSACGRQEEGLELIEGHFPVPDQESEHFAVLGYLYAKSGRQEAADKARQAYVITMPPYIAPARQEHLLTVGVINRGPDPKHLLVPTASQHFGENFPSQLQQKLADRYRFASVILGSAPSAISDFCAFRPDVVINNLVNAEFLRTDQTLPLVKHMAEAAGAPVINAPERVAQCTRQMNSLRLQGLPNAIVPKISRFRRDAERLDELVREIEAGFAYPMIVRTVGDQKAINMVRADSETALREVLLQRTQKELYVIEYVGARRRQGLHRRIRAGFVDGVPVVLWADYADQWVVQSRKWDYVRAAYRDRPDLRADADEIIRRPIDRLGAAAMATLDHIGRLVPLDIFGLDFDVDDHGRVVFFEANPTMNLLSKVPPEWAYPAEAEAALIEQIKQSLEHKASLPQPALRLNS